MWWLHWQGTALTDPDLFLPSPAQDALCSLPVLVCVALCSGGSWLAQGSLSGLLAGTGVPLWAPGWHRGLWCLLQQLLHHWHEQGQAAAGQTVKAELPKGWD